VAFDESKLLFFYTADNKVDFRELVRILAQRFHTRVEMRQVGVRDEARLRGGFGHCGQMLCCARHLRQFHPVTIRMAKDQGLSLNPAKISGLCGRLMCCLRYEASPRPKDAAPPAGE
jgi:cell fate regulator YaaT (PSP1 superfamily)